VLWGRNSVVASGDEQFMIGETARQSVDVIYNRLFISDEVKKLDVLKRWETTMFARAESRFAMPIHTEPLILRSPRSDPVRAYPCARTCHSHRRVRTGCTLLCSGRRQDEPCSFRQLYLRFQRQVFFVPPFARSDQILPLMVYRPGRCPISASNLTKFR
jgi:hypothetical protein